MDYQALVNYRNSQNTFAIKNGVVTEEVEKGYARCRLDLGQDHFNVINSVHGGALFTLMDSTGGATATSYGDRVTTMSSNVVFLNPITKPITIYGVGRMEKYGRKIIVVEVKVLDDRNRLYAQGTFTFYNLKKEINNE